jgi:phosphoesterase RecJ-like protein
VLNSTRFHTLLNEANSVSILTHINPDADTLGTGLGIYEILKRQKGKRVEIVNASPLLPQCLDFLPHFHKVKQTIEFEDSLIITCDCGSLDRVGFSLEEGREIINIDHHISNTHFGTLNMVDGTMASTSQVAYQLFKHDNVVTKAVATCFYTALVSDTNFFTTSAVTGEVFEVANEFIGLGVRADEVAFHLTQRKSLSALRTLQMSLETLQLHFDGTLGIVVSSEEQMKATGATVVDLDGVVESVRALATVQIAIHVMELEHHYRVSLRSKQIDIVPLAKAFGGGGHTYAAGFRLEVTPTSEIEDILATILQKVKVLGLLT